MPNNKKRSGIGAQEEEMRPESTRPEVRLWSDIAYSLIARDIAYGLIAVVAALMATSLVLIISGTSPLAAFSNILIGAFGPTTFQDVLIAWVPLSLAATGLLITFTSGLWNIGIEGQIVLGGVFTTWMLRLLAGSGLPPAFILAAAVLAGMTGGALWAILAGALKTFGGVSEIFGGLGLNFVAQAINLWLIFGPWKRPGIASMSGTLPFPEALWMPTISAQSRLSLPTLFIAMAALAVAGVLLANTHLGLRFKAVGKNPRASFILGIPAWQHMMGAFALCGVFAGMAGAVQVTAVYHRLIPSISSGYGYLGLMVAMLANCHAIAAGLVAFVFAALGVGSIRLPIVLHLDSSLAGVIQGCLVLAVLLVAGLRATVSRKVSAVRQSTLRGIDGHSSGAVETGTGAQRQNPPPDADSMHLITTASEIPAQENTEVPR